MGLFGTGVARICAVVAASSAGEMAEQLRCALRENADCRTALGLAEKRFRTQPISRLAATPPSEARGAGLHLPSREGGGLFAVASGRAELAGAGRRCRVLVVRPRGRILAPAPRNSIRQYSLPRRILLSIHDFQRIPPLQPLSRLAGEARSMPSRLPGRHAPSRIARRLLPLRATLGNCVAVPMGEVGLPARLLALREGSPLAYAPVSAEPLPGQVSLQEMKHLYRATH